MVQIISKSTQYIIESNGEQYVMEVNQRQGPTSDVIVSSYGHEIWTGSVVDIVNNLYPSHIRGILCQYDVFEAIISATQAYQNTVGQQEVVYDKTMPDNWGDPGPRQELSEIEEEYVAHPDYIEPNPTEDDFPEFIPTVVTPRPQKAYEDMDTKELFELAMDDGIIDERDTIEDWTKETIIEILREYEQRQI